MIPALVLALAIFAAPALAQAGSPAGPVPVELLAARRQALMDRIGTGVALVCSARPRSLAVDHPQDSDYREENDFFYLTGLESPDSWLMLLARSNGRDSVILFLPEAEAVVAQWTGVAPAVAAARRATGISDVRTTREIDRDIGEVVLGSRSPVRGGALLLDRRTREGPPSWLRRGAVTIRPLEGETAALRQIKDEDEIRRLRRAVAITGASLQEAMRAAEPGRYEYELEALIEYGFRRRGAERVGFPSIVGSGANGTILHYDENRRRTQDGDLVVIDVGAEYGYYSADITRTIPVSGRFSPRQRDLYQLVLGAQQAALDSVRPGIDLSTLDRIARAYLREHSRALCGDSGCERYFIHGLSHWLGMGVHDVGSYGRRLEPGMVLTVEPGLYLPEEGIGIRIEDDVLVTAAGAEVLSAGVPRSVAEVERAMAESPIFP